MAVDGPTFIATPIDGILLQVASFSPETTARVRKWALNLLKHGELKMGHVTGCVDKSEDSWKGASEVKVSQRKLSKPR
jgi:hypothetical protein